MYATNIGFSAQNLEDGKHVVKLQSLAPLKSILIDPIQDESAILSMTVL